MLGALSFRCQRWDEAVKWGTAKTTIYLSSNTTGGEESGLDSLISAGFRMVFVRLTSKRNIHLTLSLLIAAVCVSRSPTSVI